ncbi:MAG TPA: dihydroxy-acid dehydratase [Symbiobacteriaceae bacterium]|jgi:dihydroxyacid dehydratase/phosphogluconate dehydratase
MSSGRRSVIINNPINPYTWNVQGKANEPITVAALLDRAHRAVGESTPDWPLTEIYDRLEENAARIAIIGGSWDHPAHVMDLETVYRAALAIWREGGVPLYFSHPVMCDGTAQSTMGMSYSLQSRNAVAAMVANQMEAQIYHGAFVIAGCDKTPMAVVAGLANVDTVRRRRGEAPVFATFAPAHVLKGGTIPAETMAGLAELAVHIEQQGYPELAHDLRDTMTYILQCSSGTAFQGVFLRAVDLGLLTLQRMKEFERDLSVATCDAKGGICAFNGTGNSSRMAVAALGFAHPAVDLLAEPPTTEQVNRQVADLFKLANRPECGVREILRANIRNVVRIHSATGGSSNLMMHMVAAMKFGGFNFSVHDIDKIRTLIPVPDIFNYSLTEGRDIFQLALQKCAGQHRGVETVMYELLQNGMPMDVDAMTVTGTTWRERLRQTEGLSAAGVTENPIILHTPRRDYSGVEVLAGNFFDSAEVKIAGMPTYQVETFDDQVNFVLHFESEEDANKGLLDPHILDKARAERAFPEPQLRAMARYNAPRVKQTVDPTLPYDQLFEQMVKTGVLKVTMVISGQGPEAFGMPEMFTPMQHVNANQAIRRLATIFSDGRYSGVSYGAAVGHVTPEAARGGSILRLKTGDLLHIGLFTRRIDLLDPKAFAGDRVVKSVAILAERDTLAAERAARIKARQRFVAAANRMVNHTDAANGVVPQIVADEATESWQ